MVREKIFKFGSLSVVFILLILFGAYEGGAAEKKTLTWGTTASTSGTFTYYVAAAKGINGKIPEINLTVRATGGGVHNARLLEKHEVDIGSLDTRLAWDLMQGAGPFKEKYPDIRLLNVSAVNPLQFVVSERSGIKDISGLEGKLYCPGMLGGTTEQIGMEVCRLFGVQPKLRHMSYADALEAMKNENIVGFVKYGAPDSSILDVASAMKIRILSFSEGDIEKIVKNVVGLRRIVVPAGTYPGVGEFKTVANEWSDYVGKEFPADLAYKMVKNIWENRSDIKMANPMFLADAFPEVTTKVKVGYLHPGAVKFYRELGLKVPQNLIPPEMGEK